ncbi:Hypothetical predicted protein [Marmota monax]|uniref:Uncharacterized protein n=1 Tax=Marmota monax TaxID=9995 RepID=A0A5E4BHZ1_MARMO|nr:hypothetical protein GHT09_002490 [Marmota monax]VTJ68252.1 Hypothetical predicted protein [Marmota monax]
MCLMSRWPGALHPGSHLGLGLLTRPDTLGKARLSGAELSPACDSHLWEGPCQRPCSWRLGSGTFEDSEASELLAGLQGCRGLSPRPAGLRTPPRALGSHPPVALCTSPQAWALPRISVALDW